MTLLLQKFYSSIHSLSPLIKCSEDSHVHNILSIHTVAKYKRRLTQINLNDLHSRRVGQNASLVKSNSLGWQDSATGEVSAAQD